MEIDKRLVYSELYDSILSKSKMYNIGDKPFIDLIKKARHKIIYEPGCGTGLITKKLAKIGEIVASDPSSNLIKGAKKRLKRYKKVRLIKKSAVNLKIKPVDLIAMRYVYHHIPDSKKNKFIKTMYSNLKKGGKMIILDEFLPFYRNKKEWKKALIKYHDKKTEIALKMNDKVTAECEHESKEVALKGIEEYKVHLKILEKHLKNAGFSKIKKVLIKHPRLKNSKPLGMYIIIAEKI